RASDPRSAMAENSQEGHAHPDRRLRRVRHRPAYPERSLAEAVALAVHAFAVAAAQEMGAGRVICVGAPEEPRLKLARRFGAEATVNIEETKDPQQRIARVRDIVGGFGADLVMDCSGHPSAGPEGIEMLRDGGTYVEMGQFTDAGSIATSWHRICAKDINVLGSWAFTANDLPLGVDMLYRTRDKYPWLEMQTLYPLDEDGVSRAVKDAMAMKAV